MEPKVARLHGNHEAVFVYLFNGVGALHCGVCGKGLLLMEEYTRHQSPVRWSLSGNIFDEVEIGLRRTSVKPYVACRMCYPFIYLDEDDRTTGEIRRAWEGLVEQESVMLETALRTDELKTERTYPMLIDSSKFYHENLEDDELTIRLPRVRARVWDIETEQVPAISKEQVEEYGTGVSSKSFLEMFVDEAGRKGAVDEWLT